MIEPFRPMQFVLREVFHFQFVKFRFGRVPLEYFEKMLEFIEHNQDVIFVEGVRNNSYGYGVYLRPGPNRNRSMPFSSLFTLKGFSSRTSSSELRRRPMTTLTENFLFSQKKRRLWIIRWHRHWTKMRIRFMLPGKPFCLSDGRRSSLWIH